jgi:hypothetical protein
LAPVFSDFDCPAHPSSADFFVPDLHSVEDTDMVLRLPLFHDTLLLYLKESVRHHEIQAEGREISEFDGAERGYLLPTMRRRATDPFLLQHR